MPAVRFDDDFLRTLKGARLVFLLGESDMEFSQRLSVVSRWENLTGGKISESQRNRLRVLTTGGPVVFSGSIFDPSELERMSEDQFISFFVPLPLDRSVRLFAKSWWENLTGLRLSPQHYRLLLETSQPQR